MKLHDCIVSQLELRWPIRKDASELEHEKANLNDPTLVNGQNIATSSDVEVHKCRNTIKALNLFNIELLNKKDDLIDLQKHLFEM